MIKKFNLIKNYKNFIKVLNCNFTVGENKFHILKALNWLINSQTTGYAHSFHFVYGFFPPYPETTGYIIPTMLECYKLFGDRIYYESAIKAVKWLKSIQNEDGSFYSLKRRKQVFDTGQILTGFNYIYKNFKEIDIKNNLIRAANWLCEVQENDGSWIKFAYNNIPHSYYSKVGSALIEAGLLLKNELYFNKGVKNIKWVLSCQLENGFFKYVSFDKNPPFSHTMMYVLEGLIKAYKLLKKEEILLAVLKNSEKLINQKDILCSQYNESFECVNNEKCITGLAQWAGVCFDLFKITQNENYLHEYQKTISFLKSHQFISDNKHLDGGLPGSIPYSGKYMKYSIPNWGLKFFIDALLKEYIKR